MKRTIRHILALLALTVALGACARQQPPVAAPLDTGKATVAAESRLIDKGKSRPSDGDPAPDFSYTMPDGTVMKLSDLRGKRVLVNFWATWCIPCREEMPELEQAQIDGKGELVVLAVNRNELPEAIARYGKEFGYSFPLIADIAGAIGDRYGVNNLPTTFFVNPDGTISAQQVGALTPKLLAERLEAMR